MVTDVLVEIDGLEEIQLLARAARTAGAWQLLSDAARRRRGSAPPSRRSKMA